MRFVTFGAAGGPDRVGLVVGSRVHALGADASLVELLGDDGERLERAAEHAERDPTEVLALDTLRLHAPIRHPRSLRDFYAFEQHVRTARRGRGLDVDPAWYEIPVFYFGNHNAIAGPGDEVSTPPGCEELDYELEVAAVLRQGGADLTPDQAERRIAGYMVMNDWSARDLQRREMRLGLGPAKGKDFATTLGPMLVTPDELADRRSGRAYALTMTASVNGVEYSRASLADIHWSFGEMIAYASRGTRLHAGEVFGSGTCGTGCILELSLVDGPERYPWLAPGDRVELTVERLGTVVNRIGPPSSPGSPAT